MGARLTLLSTAHPATQIFADTDSRGAFGAYAPVGGEYRVVVAPDQGQAELLSDADFVEAHKGDFPPVLLTEGDGPRFTLKMPAPAPR